jgi:hypothetical protein
MKLATLAAAVLISGVSLAGAGTATAAPTAAAHSVVSLDRHACTRTSTGHCIRGGEFCPRSKYGRSGWDARGRRYVCKGNRAHPHWMLP